MCKYVLEDEAVLVDLRVEKGEELLCRDDIVRGWAVGFNLIVVQVPLAPLLIDHG
jgi:hypothetical protein